MIGGGSSVGNNTQFSIIKTNLGLCENSIHQRLRSKIVRPVSVSPPASSSVIQAMHLYEPMETLRCCWSLFRGSHLQVQKVAVLTTSGLFPVSFPLVLC